MKTRYAQLVDLLVELFAARELLQVLRGLADGHRLVSGLAENAPLTTLAADAVDLLQRRGRLDRDFFRAVASAAGRQRFDDVATVATLWGLHDLERRTDVERAPPTPRDPVGPHGRADVAEANMRPWFERSTVLVAGSVFVGSILDTIANAGAVVTPTVTWVGVCAVTLIWAVIELWARDPGIRWGGVRMTRLGWVARASIIGVVAALLLPRMVTLPPAGPELEPEPMAVAPVLTPPAPRASSAEVPPDPTGAALGAGESAAEVPSSSVADTPETDRVHVKHSPLEAEGDVNVGGKAVHVEDSRTTAGENVNFQGDRILVERSPITTESGDINIGTAP